MITDQWHIFLSELTIMDEDFLINKFDDTVGKKELELDQILANTKLTAKIGFGQVGVAGLKFLV